MKYHTPQDLAIFESYSQLACVPVGIQNITKILPSDKLCSVKESIVVVLLKGCSPEALTCCQFLGCS